MATTGAARRVTFFLAFSVCLIAASLVVELLWRGHVREAIELGPLTPMRMQSEIASELQMFGIGMGALAIGRGLLAIPTAIFWLLWLLRVIRRTAVVAMWSVCTVGTVAVTVSSVREARTVASHAGPGLPREAILKIMSEAAEISIRTDLALLVLAVAALVLVRTVTKREPPLPSTQAATR